MKAVQMTAELIETMLTEGFNTDGSIKIIKGLPKGSKLVNVMFDARAKAIMLIFDTGDSKIILTNSQNQQKVDVIPIEIQVIKKQEKKEEKKEG